MYRRLTSPYHLRTLFAAAAATATYSSRRCLADPPPSPATGEKVKIRGETLPENDFKRKTLPPKLLSENVAMLTCESSAADGICNVHLIGTYHGSPESRREVKDVIQFLKPEVVFLELCPTRLPVTLEVEGRSPVKFVGTLHEKPDGLIIDEMTVGKGLESSEFVEAYYQAMKYGAKVILGDRPTEITMRRIVANISNWDLIKFKYYTMFHKDGLPAELNSRLDASMKEPILHERDQYMSAKILEVASEHNSVVAIVGKGHLVGIQKNWKQPVELERLLSVPTYQITTFIILDPAAAAVIILDLAAAAAFAAWAVAILRRLSKK